jgi:Putative restriction endonuclease
MVTTPRPTVQPALPLQITWEKLPDDVPLEEEPVENTGQPLIAGALREPLELAGYLKPEMLVAGNLGLCATMNGKLAIKAPDWLYVASVAPVPVGTDRRSYTPHLEGEVPRLVMEFLSHTEGDEYSAKHTYPPGKWFFYEQILQIPTYILFASDTGDLEVYQRQSERYELATPTAENRYWLADMGLFLGVWQGEKEERSGYWLRWWDQAGTLLPWAIEKIEQERARADQEHNRANQERDRAAKLAEYLRSQGIDPDAI